MVSRVGVKLRPTVEREELRNLVLSLRAEGLSYNAIIERVEEERRVRLAKSHVSGWVTAKHEPFGSVRAFEAKPTPELAYVIGVTIGDGSTNSNRNHNHMIKLRVTDTDFAAEFATCVGELLCRGPTPVKWRQKTHSWYTGVSSLLLQRFVRQELKDLIPTISHCDDCKAVFLRGFFDSKGSIRKRRLVVSNGELGKLELVCMLLESLGETLPDLISTKKGRNDFYQGTNVSHQQESVFCLRSNGFPNCFPR